jgi:hypothetical protein
MIKLNGHNYSNERLFLTLFTLMKGFSSKWCSWIQQIVSKGGLGMKVNSSIGHNFHTKKGVRQGGPSFAYSFQSDS